MVHRVHLSYGAFLVLALSALAAEPTSPKKSSSPTVKDLSAWLGSSAPLSNDTIVAGLKGGLSTGVDRALAELGKPDGFLQNAAFKILLPPELAKSEKALRKLKQDQLADGLILALNRTAEQSMAAAVPIFKEAISGMTVADALAILKGPPDGATTYFRTASANALRERLLPIVEAATDATIFPSRATSTAMPGSSSFVSVSRRLRTPSSKGACAPHGSAAATIMQNVSAAERRQLPVINASCVLIPNESQFAANAIGIRRRLWAHLPS